MNIFQKSLLAVFAISLFLPLSQGEDKIYRIEGIPEIYTIQQENHTRLLLLQMTTLQFLKLT